ncbi:MAG: molecular chaperone TorD family protein [Anaerolineales bacterium]|nr:molecular chaperone TorD family protein [Anaerolineales bacterium]
MEKLEMLKTTLLGETLLFGLLGKALYQDPHREWLVSLIAEDIFAEAPFSDEQAETERGLELLQGWARKNSCEISDEELKALQKDYLYLFIGTGRPLAPVWESVYFSEARLIFQKETLEVREWYTRFALEAERKGREPDDHIGLELSFTSHLAALALLSLENEDDVEFEKNLQAQRDFLTQHLLRWAPIWANLVVQHAQTDFYRGLAYLTNGALLSAAHMLEIDLPKEAAL